MTLFRINFEGCGILKKQNNYVKYMHLNSSFIWYNFYNVLRIPYLPKLMLKTLFYIFQQFLHFFKLQKCLIFGSFILDLSSKWLLDAFNIHVIYFEQKKLFHFHFKFFFGNIKRYLKFQHISANISIYIYIFQFSLTIYIFALWELFDTIFRNKTQQTK